MKVELNGKMVNASIMPISAFNQGKSAKIIHALTDDEVVIVVRHGKPLAMISKIPDNDSMIQGIIPID